MLSITNKFSTIICISTLDSIKISLSEIVHSEKAYKCLNLNQIRAKQAYLPKR